MPLCAPRKVCGFALLVVVGVAPMCLPASILEGGNTLSLEPEFSGTLIKRVNGKTHWAQVFGKGDRLRLEYKYAVRTERGFSAIEIIRMDRTEVWYLHPQLKELLVAPLTGDVISIRPRSGGETHRTFVGDATVAGRAAQLFDIQAERRGHAERFYEWVDAEIGIVLKLVSQDRDWSFEYERIRVSPQPGSYFDEPPGYQKRMSAMYQRGEG